MNLNLLKSSISYALKLLNSFLSLLKFIIFNSFKNKICKNKLLLLFKKFMFFKIKFSINFLK